MKVVTDMWLAPNLPGYDEVRNFYTKMAQKLAFAPGMGGMAGMMGRQAGMMKGMSEMYKEASKLEGVPVLQVIRMAGMADGMSEADMAKAQQQMTEAERAQQQQQQQAPAPSAGDAAESAATGAALGRDGKSRGNCRRSRRFRWIRKEEEAAAGAATTGSGGPAAGCCRYSRSRCRGCRPDTSGNADGTDHRVDGFFVSSSRCCEAQCSGRV